MSKEEIEWLKNVFPTFIGRTLMKDTLSAYYKAEMLLNGWDTIKKRGCTCNYRSLKETTEKSYTKWIKTHS